MTILTLEQMTQAVMKTLDAVVAEEFPENEREEAKAKILNVWSREMFQDPEEKE
jgi:hypothetical protein